MFPPNLSIRIVYLDSISLCCKSRGIIMIRVSSEFCQNVKISCSNIIWMKRQRWNFFFCRFFVSMKSRAPKISTQFCIFPKLRRQNVGIYWLAWKNPNSNNRFASFMRLRYPNICLFKLHCRIILSLHRLQSIKSGVFRWQHKRLLDNFPLHET